jgi:hypothetical protein
MKSLIWLFFFVVLSFSLLFTFESDYFCCTLIFKSKFINIIHCDEYVSIFYINLSLLTSAYPLSTSFIIQKRCQYQISKFIIANTNQIATQEILDTNLYSKLNMVHHLTYYREMTFLLLFQMTWKTNLIRKPPLLRSKHTQCRTSMFQKMLRSLKHLIMSSC